MQTPISPLVHFHVEIAHRKTNNAAAAMVVVRVHRTACNGVATVTITTTAIAQQLVTRAILILPPRETPIAKCVWYRILKPAIVRRRCYLFWIMKAFLSVLPRIIFGVASVTVIATAPITV